VRLDGLSVDFDGRFQLHEIDWQISHGEHWLLLGANGAGKSALAAVLAGYGEHISGTIDGLPPQVALVSYEAQAELIDAERRKDDADILDVISEGTPVREMVFADGYDVELAKELVEAFGLEKLLDRAFRKLSTGETRKLMIVRALSSRPHLKTSDLEIPPPDSVDRLPPLDPSQPLVELKSASIRYGDTVIFENIDWRIERGEHWQLSGPNGSGKTGLLSLITGDHPQCYVNDILAFGYRRGSGESIWEIKRYIGYVSTALQWEYRVGTGLRNVVISGFHDSIGLYTKATDEQRRIADAWLELLGMSDRADTPFTQLSYGDQRLVLIARAMVKHPPLLILDEPCLGLDDMNRQLVIALIERICARSETTVLYVNHHASDRIAGIEHMLELAASPVSVS